MGITFSLMEKLRARNVLAGTRIRVLDIGSSNLYQADAAGIIAFVKSFPQANTWRWSRFPQAAIDGRPSKFPYRLRTITIDSD